MPGHLSRAVEEDKVYSEVKDIFLSQTTAQWQEFAGKVDCCLTVVGDAESVINEEYAGERKIFLDVPTHGGKSMKQVRSPMVFGQSHTETVVPPPALGQHNTEIYGTLGLDQQELEILKHDGVV